MKKSKWVEVTPYGLVVDSANRSMFLLQDEKTKMLISLWVPASEVKLILKSKKKKNPFQFVNQILEGLQFKISSCYFELGKNHPKITLELKDKKGKAHKIEKVTSQGFFAFCLFQKDVKFFIDSKFIKLNQVLDSNYDTQMIEENKFFNEGAYLN